MTDKELLDYLLKRISKNIFDINLYLDSKTLIYDLISTERDFALNASKKLRMYCSKCIKTSDDLDLLEEMSKLSDELLRFEGKYLFESYMLYLEKDRKPNERFYIPRIKPLRAVVTAIQELADDKLDELFISMPPRVGKTTLLMFLITWILGKDSEKSNLYSAYSDVITKKFYDGILEVIDDSFTYKWKEIFEGSKIVATNSKDETINIDRNKRYPSVTCRSLYGTLNGACDCNGFLIADDLLSGIEEAMNPDRLSSAWAKVDNNLLPRAKEKAKILWCGTRWSLADPIGNRLEVIKDVTYQSRRVKIINLPALDENDESNFNYPYNVGYSTDFYRQRRASFERNNDIASWTAQYQGEPIERVGALFLPEDMNFYNGVLPSDTPDRIFMACDVAFGGGDYLSAPIAYQYGSDIYIHGVVFDNGDKKITQPRVCQAIKSHNVQTAMFEKNNGGEAYQEDIERMLLKKNYKLNITSKSAPTTKRKEERIFERAPEIRSFFFLDSNHRDRDYNLFMQNLFSFKITGRNKHDDAPDSLAQLVGMVRNNGRKSYEIMARPY